MGTALPTKAEFLRYERVRREGRFNMLTPQARLAARLTEEVHSACIEHYDTLSDQYLDYSPHLDADASDAEA